MDKEEFTRCIQKLLEYAEEDLGSVKESEKSWYDGKIAAYKRVLSLIKYEF